MTANEYEQALNKAKRELDDLLRQRSGIDRQIERLKRTVEALAPLCGPDYVLTPIPDEDGMPRGFGITMTIRQCLADSPVPLTPVQLRDAMINRGIDMSEYANDMSVVHNTLRRLVDQGEVTPVKSANGPTIGYILIPAGLPPPPGIRKNEGMVYDRSNMPPAKNKRE